MAQSILLVTKLPGIEEALRGANIENLEIVRTKSDDATAAAITTAEIILGDPPVVAPHINHASALQWMQSTMAGVEALAQGEQRKTDFQLTRLKGIFGPQMAEYVIGQILVRERRVFNRMVDQSAKVWGTREQGRLSDLTLGILGLGDIGLEVAAAAKLFGMRVLGLRSSGRDSQPLASVDAFYGPDDLDQLLAQSDYIVNILPSTQATRGLLSGDRLKSAKPGAVLINIGRGDVIDEASIVEAVTREWIGGASLDVFPAEPLPEQSLLWDLPGIIITPHVAALSYPADCVRLFEDNLERYRSGKALQHLVDWDRGY